MSNMKGVIIAAVLASVLVFGLVSCGGQEEPSQGEAASQAAEGRAEPAKPAYKEPPTTPEMPPKASDLPVTVAEQLKIKQEIPDYYPADAPVYPGSLPSSVRIQGSKVILGFGTAAPRSEVGYYMESDLSSQGWDVNPVQELPTGLLIQGTKDGRSISVLVASVDGDPGDETTMIMISVQR